MRTLFVVSTLALALVTGCKDKPKRKAPPANVGSAAAGSGSGGMRPAPDLILPRADGTPPKKTTKPHTKADYEKLDKLEYPGFMIEHRTVGDNVFEVRHKTKDHPRLWATVTIQHCLDCVPMELDKWKAKEEDLKVVMGDLAKVKDVESEIGMTELAGQPIAYHYYVGAGKPPATGSADEEGGGGTVFGNVYVAYYNDGVNQIRVIAEYKDDPTTVESMKKLAPKDDLRALALSFLDVYTHAW